ncbi:ABC transporter ATP-binding protein [Parvularcula dongshanensis]|uniref:Phospholipid/cholesterol/gamma-HCH transport system ATP-binding protein n=1 Tax=Parvularcula dongshanensis TaxID=1173995 RepID=A0A840HY38_9PROT|nr:ATP-binding cassette domain-containing protein [Parvularcula dongshanensis]MBB4657766.1 phospholipid/cholesterol/gamma-HCH transport system ATP-binding protein [Parvularcula dongshanensis]
MSANSSAPDDEPVIKVRGLVNRFGDYTVHDDLDLDVRRGEVLGVVGGSGTGKSVLLRAIVGLRRPQAGTIELLGHDMVNLSEAERATLNQEIGLLFQDGALFSSLTVRQNVMAPIKEHLDVPQSLAREVAAMKISLAGLPDDAGDKYPAELSGGMRKRAALARALALDPQVLFLDEPTAGLDPVGAERFDELIVSLRESLGLTVFMVTHDLDSLYHDCDRVAVLAEKRVIAIGSIDEVRRSDHPWIEEYFGGPRGRAALASQTGAPASRRA